MVNIYSITAIKIFLTKCYIIKQLIFLVILIGKNKAKYISKIYEINDMW